MQQLDLADHLNRYPHHAGAREETTSREAANRIEDSGRAGRLRDICLRMLTETPMTAKELAAELEEEITSVRPRLSELKAQGVVIESGIRRERQHVWQKVAGVE